MGDNQDTSINSGYDLIEGRTGEAFCTVCKKVSSINGMFHHVKTDTYYHRNCLQEDASNENVIKSPISAVENGTNRMSSWQSSNSMGSIIFFVAGVIMILIGLLISGTASTSSEFGISSREVVNLYKLHIKETLYMFGGISILCGVILKSTAMILSAFADIYDATRLK